MKKEKSAKNMKMSYVIARLAIIITLVSMILVSMVSVFLTSSTTKNIVSNDMLQIVNVASQRIHWELMSYYNIAKSMAANPANTVGSEEAYEYVNSIAKLENLIAADIIDAEGKGYKGTDFSGFSFFERAMNGETTVSSPDVLPSGDTVIYIASPLLTTNEDGSPEGVVVLYAPQAALNQLVSSVTVSENSTTHIVDSQGAVVASSVAVQAAEEATENAEATEDAEETVKEAEASQEAAALDESYIEVNKRMMAGETAVTTYTYDGTTYYTAFTPIESTNGWSLAIAAPSNDYSNTGTIFAVVGVTVILVELVALFFALKFGGKIGAPISKSTKALTAMSEGNFVETLEHMEDDGAHSRRDETQLLVESTKTTIESITGVFQDIIRVLESIANGNLMVDINESAELYVGDYQTVHVAMADIKEKLATTLEKINTAAEQVTSGSEQVSIGATNLSQGSTEQASSVAQLAENIKRVADLINANADDANNANDLTNKAGGEMGEANVMMNDLVDAMNEITALSEEITKINKTIEDIAFQTNILALNAAVEAARAGAAGKGFAVVADEVRNLAGKSAEAAKSTTALIENTVVAIEKGTNLVDDVAAKMLKVSNAAGAVAQINAKISADSKDTADSINSISYDIDQISNIVQNNSATSEESAAAAEELAGQANTLKALINQFKF